MTPQEYFSNWTSQSGNLHPISKEKLVQLQLQTSTIDYLEVGLPEDAAPYISFIDNSDDLYKGISKLEDQYNLEFERNKYVVIGSDGSGNPIAVNIKNEDSIEWLDHEDSFKPSYCNKSLERLLIFLIIYRDFVTEIIDTNGDNALLDCKFSDEQYNQMKHRMLMIDPDAVNKPGFWMEELEILIVNRGYYRTTL